MIIMIIVVMAIAVHSAAASQRSTESPADGSADDVRITFVDDLGAARTTPYIAVREAFPGMAAQVSTVVMRNDGTVAAAFDLAVVLAAPPATPSLADVLVATISTPDGTVRYHGPLAGVTFSESRLAPAAELRLRVMITWPDGGLADNQYQGQALSFDLEARARAAE